MVYFGKLPNWFDLWLISCENNPTIDFLVVTDQILNFTPNNVNVKNMTLQEMKSITDKKLGFDSALTKAYKCCDLRPFYGIIFDECLKDYDFWGHCDCDLFFGDLRHFFTNNILDQYDKIYELGHLSLYKNTSDVNYAFKLKGSKVGDYKTVFTNENSFAFDEFRGISSIMKHNGFKVYDAFECADIRPLYSCFKITDDIYKATNYIRQVFYWERGHVYRSHFDEKDVLLFDEFPYIHFQKRKIRVNFDILKMRQKEKNGFFISGKGFFLKENQVEISDINKYNYNRGHVFEKIEYFFKRYSQAVLRRVKKYFFRYF